MTEPLISDPKPTLTQAAQKESLTKPGSDTGNGKRIGKLNDELKDSQWYRNLREDIKQGRVSREEADEIVRSHGVR